MPMKSEAVRSFVFAPIGSGRGGAEMDLVTVVIANANIVALNSKTGHCLFRSRCIAYVSLHYTERSVAAQRT